MDALTLERTKSGYLNKDRSVNIQDHLQKEEQLDKSGLRDIEIHDRVKSLGKDDFLKLLVTQLSHQDPTAPVKDQQFIAQMAQFSSLEQMQNISTSIGRMSDRQSYTLVGKWVMGVDSQNGEMQSGMAEALLYDEANKPFLRVNGRTVAVEDVKVVSEPAAFSRPKSASPAASIPGHAQSAAPVAAPASSPASVQADPAASVNAQQKEVIENKEKKEKSETEKAKAKPVSELYMNHSYTEEFADGLTLSV